MFDSHKEQEVWLKQTFNDLGVCEKCWGEEINKLIYSGKRAVYTYEIGDDEETGEPLVLAWYVDELITLAGMSEQYIRIRNDTLKLIYDAPNNVDVAHLPHVDETIPGVIVSSPYSNCGYIIADGNHRAYKSWKMGKDFLAVHLSEEAQQRCMLHPEPITYGDVQEISDKRLLLLQLTRQIPYVANKLEENRNTHAVQIMDTLGQLLRAKQ